MDERGLVENTKEIISLLNEFALATAAVRWLDIFRVFVP
jgi:hypothetical protein